MDNNTEYKQSHLHVDGMIHTNETIEALNTTIFQDIGTENNIIIDIKRTVNSKENQNIITSYSQLLNIPIKIRKNGSSGLHNTLTFKIGNLSPVECKRKTNDGLVSEIPDNILKDQDVFTVIYNGESFVIDNSTFYEHEIQTAQNTANIALESGANADTKAMARVPLYGGYDGKSFNLCTFSNTSNSIGSLKINIPVNQTSNIDPMIRISGFSLVNDQIWTLEINARIRSGKWVETGHFSAVCTTNNMPNNKIMFVNDDTSPYILIGDVTASWYYSYFIAESVMCRNAPILREGWSMELITSMSNLTIIKTLYVNKFIPNDLFSGNMRKQYPSKKLYVTGQPAGAVKIKLPVSWNNMMFKMKLSGFNYSPSTVNVSKNWELLVGGYLYIPSSQWLSTTAIATGNMVNDKIRFGHDGTNCCIIIGDITDTYWAPMIEILEISMISDFFLPPEELAMTYITSLSGITFSGDTIYAQTPAPSIANPTWYNMILENGATNYSTSIAQYAKIGSFVVIRGFVVRNSAVANLVISTLPLGYRPKTIHANFVAWSNNAVTIGAMCEVSVSPTTGKIELSFPNPNDIGAASTPYRIYGMFPAEQ